MKKSELLFIAIKPPLDYLALIVAAISSYSVRYIDFIQEIRPVIFDLPFKDYFAFVAAFGILWIMVFSMSGLYSVSGTKSFKDEFAKVFVACSAGLALVLAVMVFSRFLFDSRFIILFGWFLSIVFVGLARLIIKMIQKYVYKYGFGIHRVAIIGQGQIADEIAKEFSSRPGLGFKVVERLDQFTEDTILLLKALAQDDKIDEVIQINPGQDAKLTSDLIDFVNSYHLDYKYAADLLGTQLANIEMLTYAGIPVVEVKRTKLDGWGKIYKRLFDIIGSFLLIVIFSPVMLVTAILIKLTSPGPSLFKYYRIGQFGKKFLYFKFRSMIKDAHESRFDPAFNQSHKNLREGSPMIKYKEDPRVTPFGKFIRRFSIDELPELFLVFIGKMSLVGPRPHEVEEVDKYQKHHKRLLTIKPGITGLSQVSGRSDLDFEDEVKLDTFYIENWSIGMDLQILFKTPWAVLKRRQAE